MLCRGGTTQLNMLDDVDGDHETTDVGQETGRHAEGRGRHGMDHYASKSKNASAPSTQATHVADTYQSPSPPRFNAPGQSGLQYLNGFADLHTDKIVLTQAKSVCPLSFLPSEFSKFLHLSRKKDMD